MQTAYFLKIFAVIAEMYAGFVTWAGYAKLNVVVDYDAFINAD
jgi:hypothetical protein